MFTSIGLKFISINSIDMTIQIIENEKLIVLHNIKWRSIIIIYSTNTHAQKFSYERMLINFCTTIKISWMIFTHEHEVHLPIAEGTCPYLCKSVKLRICKISGVLVARLYKPSTDKRCNIFRDKPEDHGPHHLTEV